MGRPDTLLEMLSDLEYSVIRFEAFLEDVLRPLVTPEVLPLRVEVFQTAERPRLEEIASAAFEPVECGMRWGPVWSTAWFRLSGMIPENLSGKTYGLRFDSGTEALLWRDGIPYHGFDANHNLAPLGRVAQGGTSIELLIEAACNMPLGISTFWWDHPELHARWSEEKPGRLECAELVAIDETAQTFADAWALAVDLLKSLPSDTPRAARLENGLRLLIGRIPANNPRPAIDSLLGDLSALLQGEGTHGRTTCLAVGHAHIDTAWLWPLAETRRKCMRTFSTVLRLMESYPAFRFLCSQAQQYAWIQEDSPQLFDAIAARVASGEWEPGGAMWIEPDCSAPSGESLIRQVLHGCGWWAEEFDGEQQRHLYLPDTFGFPASLPQIIQQCDLDTFITNKISWCETNRFPHVSFDWIGIDGSRVLSHLTPGHNYNSSILPADVQFGEKNLVELDRCRLSAWLQPFGFGDGGGGPTREQVARVENMNNVEGLPSVRFARADDFCAALHAQRDLLGATAQPAAEWDGELYLELHRGTYTSQRWIKQANHDAEQALRSIEMLSCMRSGATANDLSALRERLDATWKLVLLNQFHDILPGSSIKEVYDDAREQFEKIFATCRAEFKDALVAVAHQLDATSSEQPVVVFNPASAPQSGVVEIGSELHFVEDVPACGVKLADAANLKPTGDVVVDGLSMRNNHLFVSFDEVGRVIDVRCVDSPRGVTAIGSDGEPQPLNEFVLYEDRPRRWEAWDIDREYREKFERVEGEAERIEAIEAGPLRGAIEFEHAIGCSSRLVVRYTLDSGARRVHVDVMVDWREDQTLLRAEFPTDIRARFATCGIQFGSIDRPTHHNTSWEEARFEFPGHRWMDLSEPGRGFAVLDEAILGRSVDGGRLGLSLLRSPSFPDPTADRGEHHLRYALMPHNGDWREAGVDAEAEAFTSRLIVEEQVGEGSSKVVCVPFAIEVEGAASVEVAALKPSEDGTGAVLRIVEKHGAHGVAKIDLSPHASVEVVNLRERVVDLAGFSFDAASGVATVPLRPYGIVSLRIRA